MTKHQIMKMLEPFGDDIEIRILDDNVIRSVNHAYYHLGIDSIAYIILGSRPQVFQKTVELKI